MIPNANVVTAVHLSTDAASQSHADSVSARSQTRTAKQLCQRSGVTEALVLITCDRFEAYVVTETRTAGHAAVSSLTAGVPDPAVDTFEGADCFRHLLRVSAGLESAVLGEDQILGQVRDAYADAEDAGHLGPVLDEAARKAIQVGKRVRSETDINEGVVSLASAAVQLIEENHETTDTTALIVGVGEMGRLAAKALDEQVGRLLIANRTESRAQDLAATVESDARTLSMSELAAAFERADVVVTATGCDTHIIETQMLRGVGETVIVDMARPRDVAPASDSLSGPVVYDLDRLEQVRQRTRRHRSQSIEAVEAIIDRELEQLESQLRRLRADDVIATIHKRGTEVRQQEVDRALAQLDVDKDDAAVLEAMTESIVSQLLAPATERLRDAAEAGDEETLETALDLFGAVTDTETRTTQAVENARQKHAVTSHTDTGEQKSVRE